MKKPPAFPNGSWFERWQSEWCDRCWNDRGSRVEPWDESRTCDLIGLGFAHLPVPQWLESDGPGGVHCTAFRPDDEEDEEFIPTPEPVPPGQELLFDPDPFNTFPDIRRGVSECRACRRIYQERYRARKRGGIRA